MGWKLISRWKFLVALTRAKKKKKKNIWHSHIGFSGEIHILNIKVYVKKSQTGRDKWHIAKQNKAERLNQGTQENENKAGVKRCKGWLEHSATGDKEHSANPPDISVRKPLLFLSLVFYLHFGAFLTSKPEVWTLYHGV